MKIFNNVILVGYYILLLCEYMMDANSLIYFPTKFPELVVFLL